jgi:hypothetical protein
MGHTRALTGQGTITLALVVATLIVTKTTARVAGAPGDSGALGNAEDRIDRTLPWHRGLPIWLSATIADLTISGSDRTDLIVEIVRHAPAGADLAKYPVVIDERPDGLHIENVQLADERDPKLKAEITVKAPSSAAFAAIRVFEGRVTLTNLKESCDADLRRGPIQANHLAGRIRLESGIGGVTVDDSELTPGGMMRLRVFNGPLQVRFNHRPESARILAVTLNGTITSDLPLRKADKFGPRFAEATIGAGDPVMSLDVVKGDIKIATGR